MDDKTINWDEFLKDPGDGSDADSMHPPYFDYKFFFRDDAEPIIAHGYMIVTSTSYMICQRNMEIIAIFPIETVRRVAQVIPNKLNA